MLARRLIPLKMVAHHTKGNLKVLGRRCLSDRHCARFQHVRAVHGNPVATSIRTPLYNTGRRRRESPKSCDCCSSNWTPFQVASRWGLGEIVQLLLEYGTQKHQATV